MATLHLPPFPVYLAPMARYTDIAFRKLCKEQGADVLVSEFVMTESLLSDRERAWQSLQFTEDQRPIGIQLFGANPHSFAQAARKVQERINPDFIDINCGCPSHKVTQAQAGSSLLKNPQQLQDIVRATVRATELPVTVKIRTGWDSESIVAQEVGERIQEAGASCLTIHGRTRSQNYASDADWELIESVAETLDIPVIGNGNITHGEQVLQLQQSSSVAGVMIGRAALGYPWIFSEIKQWLADQKKPPKPSVQERWNTLLRFITLLQESYNKAPENIAWMRPKIIALTKHLSTGKKLRPLLETVHHIDQLRQIAQNYIHSEPVQNPPHQHHETSP